MKGILGSLVTAFSMYSTIPMPRVAWKAENMRDTMGFFPLVGVAIGAAEWGWLWLCSRMGFSVGLTAAVATALPVLLSGGIHLDGFCDTIDALASHAPAARKLEILKDPHVGSFAVIGCVLYLLILFGLWTQYVFSTRSAAMIAAGFVLSRALSGISVVTFQRAKKDGLAAQFADAANKRRVLAILAVLFLLSAALMLDASILSGGSCLVGAGIVFLYYKWMSDRQFGGMTGDLAGWFLQLCELVILAMVVLTKGGTVWY